MGWEYENKSTIMGHCRPWTIRLFNWRLLQIRVSAKESKLFDNLNRKYYSVAAAIVFDLTRPETFNSIEKVMNDAIVSFLKDFVL